jgi:ABC-type Fe3+ transport system substrate-binding protein
MIRSVGISLVLAAATALSAGSAGAGNLEKPDYPLNANEQLYADLFKLPEAERHEKIVDGAKKEDKYEMIYGFNGKLGTDYANIFKKAYPFVKFNGIFLGSNDSNPRILAEEKSGQHITDVLSGTGIMDTNQGLEAGIFARYPTPASKKILPQYRGFADPYNRWLLNHWEERGISYNSKIIKSMGVEPPKNYMDLCKPEFKGQVSFDPPRDSFLIYLNTLLGHQKFEEWVQCMGKNQPIVIPGQSLRLELMLAGDHAIQGLNFMYRGTLLRDQKGPDKVPFVPVYSTPLMANGNGCLINRNTPHPYTAALFCDWTMEDEPQNFIKSEYRGTVTLTHAFLPKDVELVTVTPVSADVGKPLFDLWYKYIGKKKTEG